MQAEWTEDDVTLLRKLWSNGATADAIARQLGGISRSAVLGKIFRLRLPPAADKAASPLPAAKQSRAPARRRGAEPAPIAQPDGRPKSLFELTNQCCRWPFRRPGTGKYFFCGVPEADLSRGIPYCPRHMKRAYNIPPVAATPMRALVSPARSARAERAAR